MRKQSFYSILCAVVVYWGWSPSNSLCVDDAGRTLLTQTRTQKPLLSTRSVSELQNDASSLERCVKPGFPKISQLLWVRSSSPSTRPGHGVCVSIEPLLGQTNWGVCYSQNVLDLSLSQCLWLRLPYTAGGYQTSYYFPKKTLHRW